MAGPHGGPAPAEPRVLRPGDVGYDAARRSFNGLVDRRPALIVQCATADHVVTALAMARDAGLAIAVRGGGHSVAGHSLIDGGVVIDLSPMRAIEVDPRRELAHAGGGCLWAELDAATQRHGLAVPGGVFGDTGIGGLTLGGGIGFLIGVAGYSCDNLVGAQMVSARGEVIEVDQRLHPDLLWALRGGGGNFGVVTRFDFSLRRVGAMWGGRMSFVGPDVPVVLRRLEAAMPDAPDELVVLAGMHRPSGPEVTLQVAFVGGPDDAERALAPIVGGLRAAASDVRPCTYLDIQAINALMPFGLRNYWKGVFVRDLDAAVLDTVARANARQSATSVILFEPVHGRARRTDPAHSAFAQRTARWHVSALGIWEDPARDEPEIAWVRRTVDDLAPAAVSGAYVNYMPPPSLDVAPPDEAARAAYGDAWPRLLDVKRRYDPENVFRGNLNIGTAAPPSA